MGNIIKFLRNLTLGQFSSYIAAIGVFDGVHRGHRQIIKKAFERARSCGAGVIAVSFSPHPRSLFFPQAPPELLMTESQRATALLAAGADDCVFINFIPLVHNYNSWLFLFVNKAGYFNILFANLFANVHCYNNYISPSYTIKCSKN